MKQSSGLKPSRFSEFCLVGDGDRGAEGEELEEDGSASGLGERTGPADEESCRVIERHFPTEAVSERSRKERYQRGKTPHTIFTWWARRPYAAACAVVTTSLIRDRGLGGAGREVIDEFCRAVEPDLSTLAVRELMGAAEQRVLDPFGGGATLPMEAARLGARAYTLDNNELSHFIQTALLRLSQHDVGIAETVKEAGKALLESLREETEDFFPGRGDGEKGRPIAYMWTKELSCPGCEGRLSLMRRPWLVRRNGRRWFIKRGPRKDERDYSVEIACEGEPDEGQSAWEGRGVIRCPFCQYRVGREEMDEVIGEGAEDRLLAVCTSKGRRHPSRKEYREVRDEAEFVASREVLAAAIRRDLREMDASLPAGELPRWSGVTNPTLYGMARHVDLFNLRQRAVLVRCCRLLREHHRRWSQELGPETAAVVAAFLSALIDQLVDWNGRLSTWISQNEQVGRGLSGPGMAMVWDYVEIDPFEEAPANLWDKLDRIVAGTEAIPRFERPPVVVRGDARELPFDNEYFDVVATDPPYYDNIFYNVLADCIYVWKRLALAPVFPGHFSADLTDSSRELTMNRHVHDSAEEAIDYYTQGMTEVLAESRRVLKPDGVLSMIYSHATIEGWASLIGAFQEARMRLEAVWPIYVERRHRPRGMRSRAMNTSFVLVAKKQTGAVDDWRWEEFVAQARRRLAEELARMEIDEVYGPDTQGRTLFGKGLLLYSQIGAVVRQGKRLGAVQALEEIAELVEELVGEGAWGVRR